MSIRARVAEGPIQPDRILAEVAAPDRGAIATFLGTVRDHHRGRRVTRLEYSAYGPMAERILREVAGEAVERFQASQVVVEHRIGSLAVGETSVLVAVAAAHRRQALAACAYVIDQVKARAPIWKREFGEGGAVWIEGPEDTGESPRGPS